MTKAATPPTQRAGPGPLQELRDKQHLTTLSVLYFVLAGLSLVFGCIGVSYLGFGAGMLFMHEEAIAADPNAPPAWLIPFMAWIVTALGVVAGIVQLVGTVLFAMTARFVATQRYRMFCLVVAGLACLSVPVGTALGVYTFVILTRPAIIARFGGRTPGAIGR